MKKGVKQLIAEANTEIETMSVEEAQKLLGNPDVQFIDLRDVRELQHEGVIPSAFHAPRGMLEFWVDPESPYHKDVFASGKKFVFYCAAAWRSALATKAVQDMGLEPVCHLEGGFKAWKDSGAPVEDNETWRANKAAARSADKPA
jgi:rhodanese-related sulfurtransferase